MEKSVALILSLNFLLLMVLHVPTNEAFRLLPKERLGNLQFLQRGEVTPSNPSSCTNIPGGHGPPCPVQEERHFAGRASVLRQ
ncbi:PREDICTED: uncharacterized protein LOC109132212 [Camelina sativa]|uniref:Uncharacterized protein LOC109132212 n=1 Tax=Camelina sativa TaxID=90675 RepID=A0ABM1RJ13_CAMSA|nr:PREDICTED: uncharacterized protein LOC109132212 [Camelina sativa]